MKSKTLSLLLLLSLLLFASSAQAQGQSAESEQQVGAATTVSAASFLPLSTTESLNATFISGVQHAGANMNNTTVTVTDRRGITHDAVLLFVSPTQVNFYLRGNVASGPADVEVKTDGAISRGQLVVLPVSPAVFTANANGKGVAAAVALRVKADGTQSYEPVARYDVAQGKYVPVSIDVANQQEQVFLVLYGTGLRNHNNLKDVRVTVGGEQGEVFYAGPQGPAGQPGTFLGLDQINVRVPFTLTGRGDVFVVIGVGELVANFVVVNFR